MNFITIANNVVDHKNHMKTNSVHKLEKKTIYYLHINFTFVFTM